MRVATLSLAVVATTTLFDLSAAQFCIEKIEDIYTQEASVTDTTRRRTYVLCPRRIFEIGTLDHNFDLQGFQMQPPLPIRPNMTIRCGDTGSRDNLCWIAEGDLHIDATPFRGISDDTVEGVSIEGLVFIGARKYSTWATKAGDITFRDCEWREHTQSVVPVMLDWFDGSNTELSVTFDKCTFRDNRYFGSGSHASLIYANGQQNALTIKDTSFDRNDMIHNNTISTTNSFIIETLGPLNLEDSCFRDNLVGVSTVAVFGSILSSANTFSSNSTGPLCGFASVFETLQQFDNFAPLCINAPREQCLIGLTGSPTEPPTTAPTAFPSGSASNSPTYLPSDSPSSFPTGQPTRTAAPNEFVPTTSPMAVPETAAPTIGRQRGFTFPTEDTESPGDSANDPGLFATVLLAAIGVILL